MATTYLSRTFGTNNSGVYKWTYSFWIKRGNLGTSQVITTPYVDSNTLGIIRFNPTDVLEVYDYQSSFKLRKITNRVFRDTSAWYNIVISSDNSVSSPVFKLFINGVQETSFSTDTNYSQNQATMFNKNILNVIGRIPSQEYFDGSISHMHFIDGTAYDASTFGSTDATSGEWVINTSPSVTYGTNGFLIMKDGNTITDQGSNSNDFTLGAGTLTDLQDCPDDVFCTMNFLDNSKTAQTNGTQNFANGNTSVEITTTSGNGLCNGTLGMSKGKFYWECKIETLGGAYPTIGIGAGSSHNYYVANAGVGEQPYGYGYLSAGSTNSKGNNGSYAAFGDSFTSGDILSFALDMDNYKFYAAKNGTWQNSGDPTSGATGTGVMYAVNADQTYLPCMSGNTNANFQYNFGNGYFGSTAISSEGTNASNIGKFEYDVPTGYTALSLKGLQE